MRTMHWSVACLFIAGCATFAAGLLTPFVDIDAGDVAPGKAVAVKGPGGDGILIFNEDDTELSVHVDVSAPVKEDRAHPGLPLPDPDWIHLDPADLRIPPHEKALCRIMIAVPPNARQYGKTFQALIVSHGVRRVKKGINVRGALESRLRFRLVRS